ncbi:hypothetical protein BDR06DRAFT_979689 [Suillus hirtellus]|nr:hypothetical protein BDR06DRAFT_979689 [Suillus hirtellus]
MLYLTHNMGFTVLINYFTLCISSSNAAFLDSSTIPLAEYVSAAATMPLDINLWYRRLTHHYLAGIKMLMKKKLVTGMIIESKSPSLAGKMHAKPFPFSEWYTSRPLELVHTNMHQVPYASFSGFHY